MTSGGAHRLDGAGHFLGGEDWADEDCADEDWADEDWADEEQGGEGGLHASSVPCRGTENTAELQAPSWQ